MTTRTAFVTGFLSALPVAIERQDRAYADCTPPSTPAAIVAVMAEVVGKLAAKALHPAGQAVGAEQGAMLREQLLVIAAAACRMAALTEGVADVKPVAAAGSERPQMSIFHITADEDAELPLDSYAAHVVVAADEDAARALCPCRDECGCGQVRGRVSGGPRGCVDFWTDPARSCCLRIGIAVAPYDRPGVVCSSFRAG